MLKIKITKQYKKDHKKYCRKDLTELKAVIGMLSRGQILPTGYNDHPLHGKIKNIRDCHIEPDFILMYQKSGNELILIRLGNHSELFK